MGNTQAGQAGGLDPAKWRDAAVSIFQPSVVSTASTSINPNVADATAILATERLTRSVRYLIALTQRV